MLTLNLKSLTLENFKSFRSRVTLDFDGRPGLNFLTGRNDAEPSLGANGAGKSSLWDGVYWCLFGVSALGDRASDLVTWGVKRPYAQVVIMFGDDGDTFTVQRWGSPDKLLLDDEVIDQSTLNDLLHMTGAQFGQSVIFGQSARMFYDLTLPERGALLNSVLDLSVWDRATAEAGTDVTTLHAELRTLRYTVAEIAGAIEAITASIADSASAAVQWDKEFDEAIESRMKALSATERELDAASTEYAALRREYVKPDRNTLDDLMREHAAQQKTVDTWQITHRTLEKSLREAQNLTQGANCATCGQVIHGNAKAAHVHNIDKLGIDAGMHVSEAKQRLSTLFSDLAIERERIAKREREMDDIVRRGGRAGERVQQFKVKLDQDEQSIIRDVDNRRNPFAGIAEKQQQTIKNKTIEQDAALAKVDTKSGEIAIAEYWQQSFKLIRLEIIENVLLHWQIETANAASLLGIRDWIIEYKTETETKTGTTKYGVQIAIRAPGAERHCALPSGGEGQRIRLAIEMGLASLVQRQTGVRWGFEVWDEPSAYLSDEGLEDMIQALRERALATDKTVWLTDHRTYGFVFDNVLTVVKDTKRGSYIEAGSPEMYK